MRWSKRERLMGDKLAQQVFPFQCMGSLHQSGDMQMSAEDFDFCVSTFGRGSYAMILGTGYWHFNAKSRWIYQRGFVAFRSETDRLVFLMYAAGQ